MLVKITLIRSKELSCLALLIEILRWIRIRSSVNSWYVGYDLLVYGFHFLLPLVVSLLQPLFKGLFLKDPIVHEVEVKAFSYERFTKHWDYLLIVWSFLKLEFTRVVHKVPKLSRKTLREFLYCRNSLFNFNLLVLFFFCLCWQALPRETTFNKVHEHHSDLFEVVSSSLFNPHVSV